MSDSAPLAGSIALGMGESGAAKPNKHISGVHSYASNESNLTELSPSRSAVG